MSGGAIPSTLARFARTVGLVVALAAAALLFVVARIGASSHAAAPRPDRSMTVERSDDGPVAVTREAATTPIKSNKRADAPLAAGAVLAPGPVGGPVLATQTLTVSLPGYRVAIRRCRSVVESLPESRASPQSV